VFIAKLDPSGSALVFSTYLGGSGDDSAAGVAIDSGFNIIVAGTTKSGDFPVMNAFQTTQGSSTGQHVFVSELDPVGQKLLYSTYLRGGATETASGVAVDPRNKIFITGTTTSTDFPVTSDAFQSASRAANQFFVSKIDPARSSTASLAYSTYFGGGNPSTGAVAGGGIAVDKNNAVYFTGATNFLHTGGDPASDFPILNASQGCLDSPGNPSPCPTTVTNLDAFVAKLDPTKPIGSHLIYSTYFGGAGNDSGTGIAVDSGGVVYLTGTTDSPNLPIPSSTTPFQQCLGAGTTANPGTAGCPSGSANNDAFLAKFSNFTTGTTTTPNVTVLYFTYVGGSNDDQGLAIATNGAQGASITGSTNSADFPGVNNSALQTALAGARDAFLTQIDTTATTQTTANEISTFLGGSGSDRGTSIALDSGGSTFIAGETASADFPHVNAFQGALSGSSVDAFVSKFSSVGKFSITTTPVPTPNPVGVGATVTFTFNIVNNGDFVPSITVQIHPQANGQNASATASNGQCGQASGSPPAITCTLVPSAGTAAGTVTLTVAPPSNASGSTPGTPYSFGASANVVSPGTASANASVTVNDYALSLTPNSATVVAGSAATYTAQVTPTGSIPGSVSLSCTGLPTSASCSVANGSITSLTTGPQSRAIVVNTTARTTTTVELRRQGPLYAVWLPVSGLAFLGLGIGGTMSRKRRALLGFLAGAFSVLIFLQAGCGSKSSGTTTTTGTPAGTYTFTVTASSGTGASHSQLAQLTVQ